MSLLNWARHKTVVPQSADRCDVRKVGHYFALQVMLEPLLAVAEVHWTRALCASDGKGLNAYGVRGCPARFRRKCQRSVAPGFPRTSLRAQSYRGP